MTKPKKLDLETSASGVEEEDEETLAAIDEGIRDANAGRVVPAEKVRERTIQYWIEIAEEMARNGRAKIASDRKRLQQTLAEGERNQFAVTEGTELPTLSQSARKDGAPS